jgi:hypothetical protein
LKSSGHLRPIIGIAVGAGFTRACTGVVRPLAIRMLFANPARTLTAQTTLVAFQAPPFSSSCRSSMAHCSASARVSNRRDNLNSRSTKELRLDAPLTVIAEFAINLPMLVVSEREQQLTGPPQSCGGPVSSEMRIVGHAFGSNVTILKPVRVEKWR